MLTPAALVISALGLGSIPSTDQSLVWALAGEMLDPRRSLSTSRAPRDVPATMRPQLPHKDSTPSCVSDVPHTTPARDLSFYAALVFIVLPVWSVPPLSWIYVLYTLHTGAVWTLSGVQMAWFLCALAEVGHRSCSTRDRST